MGTTQRISPGVKNQPNWKDLSRSVTSIAKTVEKEFEIKENGQDSTEQEDVASMPETPLGKDYNKLVSQRNNYLKSIFKNLIKTGGGAKHIIQGKSNSLGKSGFRSSGKLVNFFSNVGSSGLAQALNEIGFGNLEGKNITDVIDFLIVYCSDAGIGMDETAANKATSEVLKQMAIESGNNIDNFEKLLKDYVDGIGLSNLLCLFWGYYIFEHLSQRFNEKITQHRGKSVSCETFKIIKDDILGRVKVLNQNRPIVKVDWKGTEGKEIIESIFGSIIKILCDED